MKLNDIKDVICDKVFIYTSNYDEDGVFFVDIYKGYLENAPEGVLDMTIKTVAAKRKGIIDIGVED